MDSLYLETSVVSHATARPSPDPAIALLQEQARDWWDSQRKRFRVVTSQLVLDEAALGDPTAAAQRLEMLADIELIPVGPRVESIAEELISRHLMPEKARLDAFHVATAASGGIQFLLTQNCRRIANGHLLPRIYQTLAELGFGDLLIYTPEVFLGGTDDI